MCPMFTVVPASVHEQESGRDDAGANAKKHGALPNILSGIHAAPGGLEAGAGRPVVEGKSNAGLGNASSASSSTGGHCQLNGSDDDDLPPFD